MRKMMWVVLGLGISQLAWADSTSTQHSPGASSLRGSLRLSGSVASALAASGQVTLAVSAAPLAIGTSVGLVGASVAGTSSNASANASTISDAQPIGAPLPITQEVLTIAPPNVALQNNNTERKTSTERKP
ncbi:MAG: hypothetical protein PHI11_05010 [Gallionella sp.]|nr:hypothetical protein [Gallionella sp.]